MNQAVHFYKTYYGTVDVLAGLCANYGFDFRTVRKPHRVNKYSQNILIL